MKRFWREATGLGPYDPVEKPLWGIPFAIKDNIDAAGLPTTAACPAWEYAPEQDAFAVGLLRKAGALLIGKTNLDQFATGLVGVRTPHPVPRNAIDPSLVPGGSSSGSAVAVARGIVSFALGTDTAGSGRVPAGLNNIVGLKPSLGALSTGGVVPACRTLDCVSIFALSVEDAWDAFTVAAEFDPADPWSRHVEPGGLGPVPSVLKVGVPNTETITFGGDPVAEAAFSAALEDLKALGAEIVPLDFTPLFDVAAMLYQGAWVAERYTVIKDLLATDPDAVHPVTRAVVEPAEGLSAADAFEGIYRLKALQREAFSRIDRVDLLCVPTYPKPATCAAVEADPIGANSELGTYTNFVNLLGLCATAVPTRSRSDGLPGSVTLIAPDGSDGLAAGMASALHRRTSAMLGATGWPLAAAAPASQPVVPKGHIPLAVVGAHLSGMALNKDLVALDARLVREAETAPDYRLFALDCGEPAKPGLLRVAKGKGAAIALEIWSMPAEGFAAFVSRIPSPLGIGTLQLADDTSVQGFLVEAEGVRGARDITVFGGWRAFMAAEGPGQMRQPERKAL